MTMVEEEQKHGEDCPCPYCTCSICLAPVECDGDCYGCEDDGRCDRQPPSHCCLCGGSPYCNCCPKCKQCIAQCGCPIAMRLNDGSEVIL